MPEKGFGKQIPRKYGYEMILATANFRFDNQGPDLKHFR